MDDWAKNVLDKQVQKEERKSKKVLRWIQVISLIAFTGLHVFMITMLWSPAMSRPPLWSVAIGCGVIDTVFLTAGYFVFVRNQ